MRIFDRIRLYLQKVKREQKILFITARFLFATGMIMALLSLLDQRMVLGVNTWHKPIKFAFSISIFFISIPYYVGKIRIGIIYKEWIIRVLLYLLMAEFILILFQAARAVQSHYNFSSVLNLWIFNMMGICIAGATLVMLLLFVLYLLPASQPNTTKTTLLIHQIALFLFLFGCAIGGRMIGYMDHAVGISTSSIAIPIIGWKLTQGDLRISHFFGLHALQVLPLSFYIIPRKYAVYFSIAWSVLTLALFIWAMLGMGFV
jgi:hypothetical protein